MEVTLPPTEKKKTIATLVGCLAQQCQSLYFLLCCSYLSWRYFCNSCQTYWLSPICIYCYWYRLITLLIVYQHFSSPGDYMFKSKETAEQFSMILFNRQTWRINVEKKMLSATKRYQYIINSYWSIIENFSESTRLLSYHQISNYGQYSRMELLSITIWNIFSSSI